MPLLLITLLLLLAPVVRAQENQAALLAAIRARMAENLLRQPNYTCLETVDRTRQSSSGQTQVSDTIRLEVALVDGKEMFAWPGSTEFQDTQIRKLVTTGMFGNGNFAIYARMLSSGSGPVFEYRGPVEIDGQKLIRYDFHVSRALSGYHLRVGDQEGIAGFHGSLHADATTLDLLRLEIVADDIPPELALLGAEDSIVYGRVRIGEDLFLLPQESTLRMSSRDLTDRNRTRFSACRKFSGESSLIFDELELEPDAANGETPRSASGTQRPPVEQVALPPGMLLPLMLTRNIDLDRAAVGDAVEAKVAADVRQGKQQWVPKNAMARGRIIRLDRIDRYFILGLEFSDLDWPGGHAPLRLRFDRLGLSLSLGGTRSAVFRDSVSGDLVIPRTLTVRLQDAAWFWETLP